MNRIMIIAASAALSLSAALPAGAADLFGTAGGLKDGGTAIGTWSGFYAGVNGGYGWDNTVSFSSSFASEASLNTSLKPAGAFGGLTFGVGHQTGGIVLGAETDIQIANIRDDGAFTVCSGSTCGAVTASGSRSTIDWFGTLRARAGFPLDPKFLVYGTAGAAYGGISARGVADGYNFSADAVRFGWVAGAGAEWKMTPNWSLKGEWLYADLGSMSLTSSGIPTANSPDNAFNIIRFGLNYKFGAGN